MYEGIFYSMWNHGVRCFVGEPDHSRYRNSQLWIRCGSGRGSGLFERHSSSHPLPALGALYCGDVGFFYGAHQCLSPLPGQRDGEGLSRLRVLAGGWRCDSY